jgi:hypothetical protein
MQGERLFPPDYNQLKAQVNDLQDQVEKCSAELQEWRDYSSLVLYALEQVFPHMVGEDAGEARTLETEPATEKVAEIYSRVRDGYRKLSRAIRELRPQGPGPHSEFPRINRAQFQAWCDIIEGKPPSIVLLHDDPTLRSGWEQLIKDWYPDACLTVFSESTRAWEKLSREFGGVLIIGDRGVGGREIVKQLMDRGARISVLVISSCPKATRQWIEQYARGGFNILYLETPCLAEDLKAVLDVWLITGGSPILQCSKRLAFDELDSTNPATQHMTG